MLTAVNSYAVYSLEYMNRVSVNNGMYYHLHDD